MIKFRGDWYKYEYDMMYFSGHKWLDRNTNTHGEINNIYLTTKRKFESSELILNIYK